eukprot:Sro401_g135261.3  (106) ;mRNA; f:12735-13291
MQNINSSLSHSGQCLRLTCSARTGCRIAKWGPEFRSTGSYCSEYHDDQLWKLIPKYGKPNVYSFQNYKYPHHWLVKYAHRDHAVGSYIPRRLAYLWRLEERDPKA